MRTNVGNLCASILVELLPGTILANYSQLPTNPHQQWPLLCKVSGLQASTLSTKISLVMMYSLQLILQTVQFHALVNRVKMVMEVLLRKARLVVEMTEMMVLRVRMVVVKRFLYRAKLAVEERVRLSVEVMLHRARLVMVMVEIMVCRVRMVLELLLYIAKLAVEVRIRIRLSVEVMLHRARSVVETVEMMGSFNLLTDLN